jgi:hypothetical protein
MQLFNENMKTRKQEKRKWRHARVVLKVRSRAAAPPELGNWATKFEPSPAPTWPTPASRSVTVNVGERARDCWYTRQHETVARTEIKTAALSTEAPTEVSPCSTRPWTRSPTAALNSDPALRLEIPTNFTREKCCILPELFSLRGKYSI